MGPFSSARATQQASSIGRNTIAIGILCPTMLELWSFFADNRRLLADRRPHNPERDPVQNLFIALIVLLLGACSKEPTSVEVPLETGNAADQAVPDVSVDRFADVELLRYEVPGFDELSLDQKKLAYYLSRAALAGRDIIYDQNYKHNLRIRKLVAARPRGRRLQEARRVRQARVVRPRHPPPLFVRQDAAEVHARGTDPDGCS